ncbi:8-oxo-dGTP diphosphatase [Weissella beninensis]|uniref:8-oxo-dGTP diphosphatase n=1 Tax=Periweissella beninensis TaxID=504936 RepID=A0ABT0VG92_9LACO|nr:(deoxy)nucleoside triphosphate pyrophosphohydrolase [Periweissella beninensis]MBM7543765.1 8-oxo-dGTP diphosphatase [Periweissella beninensis]MCM2436851.1 (deoxy)nucleoside triphosphate pyrophosphohydrolase [Periweissella beninensis]
MKKEIFVVGAAIIKDHKLLAAKRSANRSLGGYWEFPGGKIEKNENPEQALKREIFEEFGAKSTVYEKLAGTFLQEYDFGIVTLKVLYADLDSQIIKTIEHDELRWVSEEEAVHLNWAPTDIPAINALVAKGF